jgi:hypothetical protein
MICRGHTWRSVYRNPLYPFRGNTGLTGSPSCRLTFPVPSHQAKKGLLSPCYPSWRKTWPVARQQIPPQPHLRRRLALSAPLVLASLSLLVAACGAGASRSSVASIGKTTGTTVADVGANVTTPPNPAVAAKQYEKALKFTQCMRAHGIADFPDPGAGGGIQISGGGPNSDLNPSSVTFMAAQNACQKYSPVQQPSAGQQAQLQARALALSACMRKHGVPNFPDPQFMSGGRVLEKIPNGSGMDPSSPMFQAAQQKCSHSGNSTGHIFTAPAP